MSDFDIGLFVVPGRIHFYYINMNNIAYYIN